MKKPKMILFAGLWRGGVDLEPDRGRRFEFSKDEFLHGEEPEPPPFPLTEETAASLLGRSFRLVNSETVLAKSVAFYQGMERWQEWEKTDGRP